MSTAKVSRPRMKKYLFNMVVPTGLGLAQVTTKYWVDKDLAAQWDAQGSLGKVRNNIEQWLEQTLSGFAATQSAAPENADERLQQAMKRDIESGKLDLENDENKSVGQSKKTETAIDLTQEITGIHAKIRHLDKDMAQKTSAYLDEIKEKCSEARKKIIFQDIKMQYANAKRAKSKHLYYEKKLEEMKSSLSDARKAELERASADFHQSGHIITDADFANCLNVYTKLLDKEFVEKQNAIVQDVTFANLKKHGYDPILDDQASNKGIHYFNTPDPDYRIMATVDPDDGSLALRFVRVVGSEHEKNNLTSEQKDRDRKMAHKWCEQYQIIKKEQAEQGIVFEDQEAGDPDNLDEILTIVDETKTATSEPGYAGSHAHPAARSLEV